MAIGLENFPNTTAITVDYPNKNIKDNTGVGDGTPVNVLVYADYHQAFRKILSLAGITPNNLPDNVTNGYQYIDGFDKLYKRFRSVRHIINADVTLTSADVGKLISVGVQPSTSNQTLPPSASLRDGDVMVFFNSGNQQVNVLGNGADTVFGGSMITLQGGTDTLELVLDKPNNNWEIASQRLTRRLPRIVKIASANEVLSGTTIPYKGQTVIQDVYGQFNTSTGEYLVNFYPGWRECNFTIFCTCNVAAYTNLAVELFLRKTGFYPLPIIEYKMDRFFTYFGGTIGTTEIFVLKGTVKFYGFPGEKYGIFLESNQSISVLGEADLSINWVED